jgi:hypothetical protein
MPGNLDVHGAPPAQKRREHIKAPSLAVTVMEVMSSWPDITEAWDVHDEESRTSLPPTLGYRAVAPPALADGHPPARFPIVFRTAAALIPWRGMRCPRPRMSPRGRYRPA